MIISVIPSLMNITFKKNSGVDFVISTFKTSSYRITESNMLKFVIINYNLMPSFNNFRAQTVRWQKNLLNH